MYQLAEVNIARMRAPLNDPIMGGFVAQLDIINALADHSPGFVWRLQSAEGDATSIRAYDDEFILVNLSVWTSMEDLSHYVYKSMHRQVLKQRRNWFQLFEGAYTALWWVSEGHTPTPEEAKERLEHLRTHGATPYAFTFKQPFPAPDAASKTVTPVLDECPA